MHVREGIRTILWYRLCTCLLPAVRTREIDNVHLVMGICPQHDVLWEDLTVKEHLLFYSRLKGIPASEEKRHVQR